MGFNNDYNPDKNMHIPGWVRTPEKYVPTKKPLKEWTDEELRRGLCPKSGGRVEACRACPGKCLFGFAMVARMRRRGDAAHGGGAENMMRCTKEAFEKCPFNIMCDVGCEVADDSECADFILAVALDKIEEANNEPDPVEAAYLQQEREAIQEEGRQCD